MSDGWGYHYLNTPVRRRVSSPLPQSDDDLPFAPSPPPAVDVKSPPRAAPQGGKLARAAGTTAPSPRAGKQKSAAQAFIFGEPRRKHQPTHSESGRSSLPIRPAAGAGRPASPELQRSQTNSSSSKSASQQKHEATPSDSSRDRHQQAANPYRHQGGRRYLRDPTLPYPLPVDVPEMHRQTMRTLLFMRLFGAPFCNTTFDEDSPPGKVLELACGTALWSSACHDYFKRHGHDRISFTGVDIAPIAPDLNATGVNFRFVQHDLRNRPFPFPDAEFDFIFIKDSGFTVSNVGFKENSMQETMRILKPGGVVELWESDHVFRTLLPNPATPAHASEDEVAVARANAAYIISPQTGFAATQNPYLRDYNLWIEGALDKRGFVASPCAIATWALGSHGDQIRNFGSRRLALPFSATRWEKQSKRAVLTPYQESLRQTALETSVRFVESMEPALKEESGKRQDEWDRWKASMIKDLVEGGGTANGECLELGAWWATRFAEDKVE